MLEEYIKTPLKSQKPEKYTVQWEEGNIICDDNIEVFLDIVDNKLTSINYIGQLSMTGQGSITFLNDILIGKDINKILNLTFKTVFDANGIEVSHRRRKTVALPLVAIINGIYKHLGQNKIIDLEEFAYD